jgi:uncharacterized membrane protein
MSVDGPVRYRLMICRIGRTAVPLHSCATSMFVPVSRQPNRVRQNMRHLTMPSDAGFRRLVAFSDAVVAIAITLLVLPLVDVAGTIGSEGIGTFLSDNRTKLLAFLLSFAVIGRFWWSQHEVHDRVTSYNSVFVWGMFIWLFGIVFLPFPTELLSSAAKSGRGIHALYIGTLLIASGGVLLQQSAIVRRPELQDEGHRGEARMVLAVFQVLLMALALVLAIAVPAIGLWSLVLLVLLYPIGWAFKGRHHVGGSSGAR